MSQQDRCNYWKHFMLINANTSTNNMRVTKVMWDRNQFGCSLLNSQYHMVVVSSHSTRTLKSRYPSETRIVISHWSIKHHYHIALKADSGFRPMNAIKYKLISSCFILLDIMMRLVWYYWHGITDMILITTNPSDHLARSIRFGLWWYTSQWFQFVYFNMYRILVVEITNGSAIPQRTHLIWF